MSGIQQSFDARENRFIDGNALIQGWGDYNSNNPLTTKAALNTFQTDVHAGNLLTVTTLEAVGDLRDIRKPKTFKIKDTNPDCLELRIMAIGNYVKSEFPDKKSVHKKIQSIILKIRPRYPKKAPNQPRGAGKSPSEKSFASLVGQGYNVIAIITALGVDYNPPDANLSVASMQTLVDDIRDLNKNITIALNDYGDANRARRKLFNDPNTGMNKRITLIKSYLASFSGGKKSSHYIEFSQAIKGT